MVFRLVTTANCCYKARFAALSLPNDSSDGLVKAAVNEREIEGGKKRSRVCAVRSSIVVCFSLVQNGGCRIDESHETFESSCAGDRSVRSHRDRQIETSFGNSREIWRRSY